MQLHHDCLATFTHDAVAGKKRSERLLKFVVFLEMPFICFDSGHFDVVVFVFSGLLHFKVCVQARAKAERDAAEVCLLNVYVL